ncbi:MAG: hypothetical protein ACFE9L_16895 [Candidatus Hodarchaeota archaeon]
MRLEKLLVRDDIPEDVKNLIRSEIAEQEKYRNNQKKTPEAIKQGEKQFRLIFEKTPLGIELYNREG